jgi:pyruvate dehydrogenase E1 component
LAPVVAQSMSLGHDAAHDIYDVGNASGSSEVTESPPRADEAADRTGVAGPAAPGAEAVFAELVVEEPGTGLLAITSPDGLHARWLAAGRARRGGERGTVSHIETLLAPLARGAALVSVLDGHPATHAWLGAVRGQKMSPLGPDRFGQSGDIPDLYREYGLDTDAILDACAQAMLAG